ncbi:MAG: TfoX/Sxy family protein, partial [Clostridia bacterium]|nr:TfoX/Sxy family protein [Clostridia bacterium]
MSELTSLKNIGTGIARKLQSVDIYSAEDLIGIGSKEAFFRLKVRYPNTCLVFLYVLQGAIDNVEYNRLSEDTKADLKEFNK